MPCARCSYQILRSAVQELARTGLVTMPSGLELLTARACQQLHEQQQGEQRSREGTAMAAVGAEVAQPEGETEDAELSQGAHPARCLCVPAFF